MLLLCAVFCLPVWGQSATEDQIKAAYLFNFAKFVEWSPDTFSGGTSPITFCTLGRGGVSDELENAVRGKSIDGRPIKMRRLQGPEEITGCQLVFLSSGAEKNLPRLLQVAKGHPILLTGEGAGFARAGGMIGFVVENGRVLFEVNLGSAQEAHLKISSKLLALARIVTPEERASQ